MTADHWQATKHDYRSHHQCVGHGPLGFLHLGDEIDLKSRQSEPWSPHTRSRKVDYQHRDSSGLSNTLLHPHRAMPWGNPSIAHDGRSILSSAQADSTIAVSKCLVVGTTLLYTTHLFRSQLLRGLQIEENHSMEDELLSRIQAKMFNPFDIRVALLRVRKK